MDPIVGVIDETKELSDRLEKARAARAKLEEDNAARKRIEKLRADTEAEERGLANEQKLAELEEKFGPVGKSIRAVYGDDWMIVVKKPNHMHVKRYMDKEDAKTEDLHVLIAPCLIYPPRAEFEKIVEDQPAALTRAANAVSFLAGFRKEDLAKK